MELQWHTDIVNESRKDIRHCVEIVMLIAHVHQKYVNTQITAVNGYTGYNYDVHRKESYPCNRPWRPIGLCETSRLPHFLEKRFLDGGKVVSLTRRPAALYPPGKFLVPISVRGWVDRRAIVRLEGLGQLKNPITSSGIEPAALRLVAQPPTN
jgi:hypothetical protein